MNHQMMRLLRLDLRAETLQRFFGATGRFETAWARCHDPRLLLLLIGEALRISRQVYGTLTTHMVLGLLTELVETQLWPLVPMYPGPLHDSIRHLIADCRMVADPSLRTWPGRLNQPHWFPGAGLEHINPEQRGYVSSVMRAFDSLHELARTLHPNHGEANDPAANGHLPIRTIEALAQDLNVACHELDDPDPTLIALANAIRSQPLGGKTVLKRLLEQFPHGTDVRGKHTVTTFQEIPLHRDGGVDYVSFRDKSNGRRLGIWQVKPAGQRSYLAFELQATPRPENDGDVLAMEFTGNRPFVACLRKHPIGAKPSALDPIFETEASVPA